MKKLIIIAFLSFACSLSGQQSASGDLRQVLQQATQGDANAQNSLGMAYHTGDGVPKNPAAAAQWFRRAAEQGLACAQLNLALAYDRGGGVAKNEALAAYWYAKAAAQEDADVIKWFRKSASSGDAQIKFLVGLMYLEGRGATIKADQKQAQKYFSQALKGFQTGADKNNAASMAGLANMYSKGVGVPQNLNEARKWYLKAAELGDANAQYQIAAMYAKGQGVSKDTKQAQMWCQRAVAQGLEAAGPLANELAKQMAQQAAQEQAAQKQEQATQNKARLDSLIAQAEQGNADAQAELGRQYLNVDQDYKRALEWFKKSADKGNAVAQNGLGVMYQHGLGVKQDSVEAVKWFKLSAAQNNEKALYNLGMCYYQGTGVAKDDMEAFSLIKQSAEKNFDLAQMQMGDFYWFGNATPQNKNLALEWMIKAVNNTKDTWVFAKAAMSAGLMCLDDKGRYYYGKTVYEAYTSRNSALDIYKEAGSHGGFDFIGYYAGVSGELTEDAIDSLLLLRKAADAGYAPAQFFLFNSETLEGPGEVPFRISSSVKQRLNSEPKFYLSKREKLQYLSSAAAQGFPAAQYVQALNIALTTNDSKTAIKMLETVATAGLAMAQVAMGHICANGEWTDTLNKSRLAFTDTERQIAKIQSSDRINKGASAVWFARATEQISNLETIPSRSVELKPRAVAGDADAQLSLALEFLAVAANNKSKNLDYWRKQLPYLASAAGWLVASATNGNAQAKYTLAKIYENYKTTEELSKMVVGFNLYSMGSDERYKFLKQMIFDAAMQGYPDAQCDLANDYLYEGNTNRNFDTAVKLYQKAIDQGSSRAMCELALLYMNGKYTMADPAKGKDLLQRAVDLGDANAQCQLGKIYASEYYDSGAKNEELWDKAAALLKASSAQGNSEAASSLTNNAVYREQRKAQMAKLEKREAEKKRAEQIMNKVGCNVVATGVYNVCSNVMRGKIPLSNAKKILIIRNGGSADDYNIFTLQDPLVMADMFTAIQDGGIDTGFTVQSIVDDLVIYTTDRGFKIAVRRQKGIVYGNGSELQGRMFRIVDVNDFKTTIGSTKQIPVLEVIE